MKDSVILKSTRNGIHLIFDESRSFQELKTDILAKFLESKQFFQNARLVLSYSGKELSFEEEQELISAIHAHTDIHIICIMEQDELLNEIYLKKIETLANKDTFDPEHAFVYYTSIHSEETISSQENLIVLGDVEEGATVETTGSLVVFGKLRGKIHVGKDSHPEAFAIGLWMEPESLKIDTLNYVEETGFFKKRKTGKLNPTIAFIENGKICMGTIDSRKK